VTGYFFLTPSKTGLLGLQELRSAETLASEGSQRNHKLVTPLKRNPVCSYPDTDRNPVRGYAEKWLHARGYAEAIAAQGLWRCVTHVTTVTTKTINGWGMMGGAR
jgi:hypothetical protein